MTLSDTPILPIPNGFYIKPRYFNDLPIATAPPHVREIFDWLLGQANHKDTAVCKRGQCVRSYADIIEGLAWRVGWRKEKYEKSHVKTAMKCLKNNEMIITRKTTRGMIITICEYDYYQNPKNYESHKEETRKGIGKEQHSPTINKNDKNVKTTIINYKNENKFFKKQNYGKEKRSNRYHTKSKNYDSL